MSIEVHKVYRNIKSRDTIFGLDVSDLIVMACVLNIVFRFHKTDVWSGKLLNVAIVAAIYLILIFVKRQFPKGYLKNLINFLFKKRRFVADRDTELLSLKEIIDEKERH
ncbi:MAG: hypothetical protein ABII18_00225 [bacterium]|nr:hypothetical protein [bacterium]MBU1918337.1 hypothetical protein [bacterium]